MTELLFFLVAAVPAATSPPCAAHELSMKVGAIMRAGTGPLGHPVTRSGRTSSPITLAEGDTLCGGEHVVNPAGSGRIVVLNVPGGGELSILPGQDKLIPFPTTNTLAAGWARLFDMVFSPDTHQRNLTRDGTSEVVNAEARDSRVAPALGPIVIAWNGRSRGPWTLMVDANTTRSSAKVTQPYAQLDVGAVCHAGCAITVTAADAQVVARRRVRIVNIGEVAIPDWLDTLSGQPLEAALLGSWLLNSNAAPVWRDQGISLLWRGACSHVAAYDDLKRHIDVENMAAVCSAKPTILNHED